MITWLFINFLRRFLLRECYFCGVLHYTLKLMRYVLITLVLLFFVSCDKSSTMDFAVQIKGVPDGTPIFLQKVNQEDKPYTVDTLEVVNGVINAKIDKVSQPEIAILHFPNLGGNFLFFIENKDITGDINFLSNIAYFNGGNENFCLTSTRQISLSFLKRDTRTKTIYTMLKTTRITRRFQNIK